MNVGIKYDFIILKKEGELNNGHARRTHTRSL